jgi:hypothetical protein
LIRICKAFLFFFTVSVSTIRTASSTMESEREDGTKLVYLHSLSLLCVPLQCPIEGRFLSLTMTYSSALRDKGVHTLKQLCQRF